MVVFFSRRIVFCGFKVYSILVYMRPFQKLFVCGGRLGQSPESFWSGVG